MHEYLVDEELTHYRDGWITRREFIHRAALLGVGAAAAASLAATVQPRPATAAPAAQRSPNHVPEGDPSVVTERIVYASGDATAISAYVAWPAGARMDHSYPGIVVCHQSTGLTPYEEDVARRFAKQGYLAIAPDLVSRVGPPRSQLTAREGQAAYGSLQATQSARDLAAALDYLAAHDGVDAAMLAATGYCVGGGVIWRLTTIAPRLRAAAPFYGPNPPLAAVRNIRAAVLAVYGGLDEGVNRGIPAVESAMQAAGVTYQINVYPDSLHGFHTDSSPRSYNPETAPQAWRDTLAWFAQHLGLPT